MSLVVFEWIAPLDVVGRDPRRGWSRPSVSLVALVLWVIVFRIHVFVFKTSLE